MICKFVHDYLTIYLDEKKPYIKTWKYVFSRILFSIFLIIYRCIIEAIWKCQIRKRIYMNY